MAFATIIAGFHHVAMEMIMAIAATMGLARVLRNAS
jgi:hypothetical protein